jgi:hypothetical protein
MTPPLSSGRHPVWWPEVDTSSAPAGVVVTTVNYNTIDLVSEEST